jgi:hypothetical protein
VKFADVRVNSTFSIRVDDAGASVIRLRYTQCRRRVIGDDTVGSSARTDISEREDIWIPCVSVISYLCVVVCRAADVGKERGRKIKVSERCVRDSDREYRQRARTSEIPSWRRGSYSRAPPVECE